MAARGGGLTLDVRPSGGDTQWVLGIGLPIGVSRDAPDISLFFYLSIEHPFKQRAAS